MRRRFWALFLVALLALSIGVVVGSGGGGDGAGAGAAGERSTVAAPSLGLEVAVGQLLVVSFEGADVPAWVERWLRRGQAAGAILFGANAPDAATARALTRRLQSAAHGGALVATDQEGGQIRSLGFAPPVPAESDLSTPDAASVNARAAGLALKGAGVNVNLAPVADVIQPGTALAGRGYPGDAAQIARLVVAAVGAYRSSGVAATAKHFPGLGRATQNTDDAGVRIGAARAELEAADLVPFAAAVRAGVPLVMASHALYPAFDPDRIASQSPPLLEDVLRRQLKFRGVVVTDSIEAQAVLARSGVATAAERSVAAGCDIVLMTGPGSWREVYPRLLRRARRDPRFAARVRRSAARVVALKRSLGLRAPG